MAWLTLCRTRSTWRPSSKRLALLGALQLCTAAGMIVGASKVQTEHVTRYLFVVSTWVFHMLQHNAPASNALLYCSLLLCLAAAG
jgi:hypothetical protein